MVRYEDIVKKLGFDPITGYYDYHYEGHEDDSHLSPFSILTDEESDFLYEKMREAKKNGTYVPNIKPDK